MGIDSTSPFSALFFCFVFRFVSIFCGGWKGGWYNIAIASRRYKRRDPLVSSFGSTRVWAVSVLFGFPFPLRGLAPLSNSSESSPFSALIFFVFCFFVCFSSPCLLSRMARRYSDTMLQSCERRGRERPAPSSCCSVPCFSSKRLNPRAPLSSRISHPTDVVHMCTFLSYSAVWDRPTPPS